MRHGMSSDEIIVARHQVGSAAMKNRPLAMRVSLDVIESLVAALSDAP